MFKNYIIFQFLFVMAISTSCLKQNTISEKNIEEVMNEQETCWNNGDIDCFMKSYWESDSLMFVSKNGVKYGWNTTLENYKTTYPTKEAMGTLRFKVIKLDITGDNAFMVGQWNIERSQGNIGGHFTLFWKKISREWKIVADHTN